METKITLVPTHTVQPEGSSRKGSYNEKPRNYNKPYNNNIKGKYRGFKRNPIQRSPETQAQPEPKPKEQVQKQEEQQPEPQKNQEEKPVKEEQPPKTEKVESHVQEDKHGEDYQQDYDQNGYDQEYAEYDEEGEQDYKFVCEFPRAKDYSSIETISQTFPHLKDVNKDIAGLDKMEHVRCFIMRSNNEDDIHKAIKYGIWTSTPKSNEFLNNTYKECAAKNIPIYLFYSVVRSGQFVAVAQMTSAIIEKSFQFWWEGDKWVNHFQVKWLFIKDVPYKYFNHLYMDDSTPVIRARDCTNVPLETTKKMLRIYRDYNPYNSIFNAFYYMDIREDQLRSYRYSLQMYQRFFTPAGGYNFNAGQEVTSNNYQAATQYFKYNTFPAKQKDTTANVQAQKKSPPKKEPSFDLENLFKEFDITYNFYNDEKKKWEQDGAAVIAQLDKEAADSNAGTPENIKSREKEIMEGLEILEGKHKAVIKAFQEYEQKATATEPKEKLNARLKSLTDLLEKFKEEFTKSKKDMLPLYEKIDKSHSN